MPRVQEALAAYEADRAAFPTLAAFLPAWLETFDEIARRGR
jgi:hypothetical protein